MIDRDETERALREAYAGRDANDLAAIMKIFADDVTFRIVGSSAQWPAHFEAQGKPAATELMRRLVADFQMSERRTPAFVIDGDHVAVHSRVKILHNPSGTEFDTETLDLLTFDKGLCTSFLQFVDTALLLQTTAS